MPKPAGAPPCPFMIPAMLAKITSFLLLGIVRLLTGAQARWHGCPPKAEQRIYFANHQSHVDLILMWAALPTELRSITRPIAAKDYWANSRFKKWLTSAVFNAIYVDRKNGGQIPNSQGANAPSESPGNGQAKLESDPHFLGVEQDPLEPLVEALQSGDSIILFPEGTRGHAPEPQPFKAGLYNLAVQFPQVVLVPTWIHNVQRVMPKGEVIPVPVLCSVTFGTPMQVEPGEERRAFLDRARLNVMALRDI